MSNRAAQIMRRSKGLLAEPPYRRPRTQLELDAIGDRIAHEMLNTQRPRSRKLTLNMKKIRRQRRRGS